MDETSQKSGVGQITGKAMSATSANVFRSVYRELSQEEKDLLNLIKEKAQELYNLIPSAPHGFTSREASLGATKLEEAVMWIVKGVTK